MAVSAASNRSKADKDPSDWMPPAVAYQCSYLDYWIIVKTRYRLAVDQAEQTALTERLADCPNEPVTVTLAR